MPPAPGPRPHGLSDPAAACSSTHRRHTPDAAAARFPSGMDACACTLHATYSTPCCMTAYASNGGAVIPSLRPPALRIHKPATLAAQEIAPNSGFRARAPGRWNGAGSAGSRRARTAPVALFGNHPDLPIPPLCLVPCARLHQKPHTQSLSEIITTPSMGHSPQALLLCSSRAGEDQG